MARVCEITGRSGRVGNNVSHACNKTKRRFDINIQNNTFFSESGMAIRMKITPRALRLVEKKGGIDQFVLASKERDLHPKLQMLRRVLQRES